VTDGRDITEGDPLTGAAPERPASTGHYAGGPVPPGAFAPRETRPGPPAKEDLAEWWRRAVATIVDGIIVGGVTLIVLAGLGIGVFADGDVGVGEAIGGFVVGALVFAVGALLYAPLLMARTNGQTLGRMVSRCRVVRANGKHVDFWWAALREVVVKGLIVGIASAITGGIAYFVDVLWPIPDSENRALHDYVVDSRVVRT
jgi:uncharacterized RDD family membrane protein YckC